MEEKERAFQMRLLETFRLEALEHVQNMTTRLVEWEETDDPPTQAALVESLFRETHSLKGAARAVNRVEIEAVCQALESVLAAFRRHELASSPELFDLFHGTIEMINGLTKQDESSGQPEPNTTVIMRRLQAALEAVTLPTAAPPVFPAQAQEIPSPPPPVAERAASLVLPPPVPLPVEPSVPASVRVDPARVDALLLQSEELMATKSIALEHVAELRALLATLDEWRLEWARVAPILAQLKRGLPALSRGSAWEPGVPAPHELYDFLSWNSEFIQSLTLRLATLTRRADQEQRSQKSQVDNLLVNARRLSMLPFSSLLDPIPGFVRQLARTQGKEVDLVIAGGEIEMDRRILQELKDPLIHLVRNSIDHGIELPEARVRAGKPSRGTIIVSISNEAGNLVAIRVSDDGAGLNLELVQSAAIRMGLISSSGPRELSADDLRALIFESGVSTSPIITDISGRGVGLAVVRQNIQRLSGTVMVESEPGRGTTFRMRVPLTLAVFRGVLVREGESHYIIPTRHVEHVIAKPRQSIRTIESHATIEYQGKPVSLVRLAAVLGGERPSSVSGDVCAILLVSGDQRIALQIDEVLDEREVLLKGLGKQLARVRNLAGATAFADGRLIPVLDVPTLFESAAQLEKGETHTLEPAEPRPERKCILVAEDSITSRTLLRNILQGAGYDVEVAIDGMDALTRLRSRRFDAVVSDLDMPRLNGLELTMRIRANPAWAGLPVILVTALESQQDRERGIEVGANAYIVKSSFDQSNLIQVLERLV